MKRRMLQLKRNERGAMVIETVLGLTVFLISILAVMFIAQIIRVQSSLQYALGQTAKEISGYYYLLDKAGFSSITAGTSSEDISKSNETVGNVLSFLSSSEDTYEEIKADEGFSVSDIAKYKDNATELYGAAQSIWNSAKSLSDDPVSQIKGILSVFGKTVANKTLSYFVAPYVCSAIMPKYLGGDRNSADDYLKSIGVTEGMDALDFTQSQLLTDGRSIKLTVIYMLNTKKLTFGILDYDLPMKLTAATAAWITPGGSQKKISELDIPAEETEALFEENTEETGAVTGG